MIGFGFMDNLVMIQAGNVPTDGSWRQAPTLNAINAHTRSLAGDLIDNTIGVTLGFAALTSAAFGQVGDGGSRPPPPPQSMPPHPPLPQHHKIFSDVSGICFGGMVEAAAARMGLASSGITAAQVDSSLVSCPSAAEQRNRHTVPAGPAAPAIGEAARRQGPIDRECRMWSRRRVPSWHDLAPVHGPRCG